MLLKFTIPRIPLGLSYAVLALLVFSVVSTAPYVWSAGAADTGIDGMTNQRQHSEIVREIDKLGGRMETVEKYAGELHQAQLRDRMTRVETTLEMMLRMMWATLFGLGSLIANAVYSHVKVRGQ